MGKKIVLLLLLLYSVVHSIFFIDYPLAADITVASSILSQAQWVIPLMLAAVVYLSLFKKLPQINIKIWNAIGLSVFGLCVVLQITGVQGLWWAWTTMAMLVFVALAVTNLLIDRLPNTTAILIGLLVVFSSIATFELVYQTGVLIYYDFFGCATINYFVVLGELFLWVWPLIWIIRLIKKQKGINIIAINRYVVLCAVAAILCSTIWFANGFDIPIIWVGSEQVINASARDIFIIVSRGAQVFITLAWVFLFYHKGR